MKAGPLLLAAAAGAPFAAEALKIPVDSLRAEAEGEFARLPRGVTHYRWRGPGEGPVTVCVHGLSTPSFVWDFVADRLAAAGRRVLTYDLFGRGLSDRPRGAQDRGFFLDQLDALLADQEVTAPFELIGYSMGGSIATAFAVRDPDRLTRLVLLAPAGLDYAPSGLMRSAAALPGLGDWLVRAFAGAELRRAAAGLPDDFAGIRTRMAAEIRVRGYLPAVLSSQRHLLAEDQSADHRRLAATALSVRAIWGAEDSVIPISSRARLAALNPAAGQVTVPGAGHALGVTHAEAVAAAILAP
jgi:pimeloyl-ACP methyl ester carboxylesterase